MQSPDLSLAGKLDNLLSKGLCSLFGGLANTFIWLLGLLVLVGQPVQIFEYGEGLSDVSWAEWGFMFLSVLRMRPAKSSTQPRKAKTWCALKFKWAPVLAL